MRSRRTCGNKPDSMQRGFPSTVRTMFTTLTNVIGKPMEEKDLEFFRQLLEKELALLINKADATVWELMVTSSDNEADPLDRATQELSQNNVFRIRSRESRLINKIRQCLLSIESGTYGICEDCEEPIAIERLIARPVTSYCIACKRRRETLEKAIGY
jgi:DnaK suppressor protein